MTLPSLIYGADGTPATVVIEGVTYRVARVDSSGRLVVALNLPNLAPLTTPVNGQTTVAAAGTRIRLPNRAGVAVTIKALPGNTDNIFLGDSGVTSSNGHVLAAGDAVNVAMDNLNRFWIDSAVNGEGVSHLVVS